MFNQNICHALNYYPAGTQISFLVVVRERHYRKCGGQGVFVENW
jgi:hypothetical protein